MNWRKTISAHQKACLTERNDTTSADLVANRESTLGKSKLCIFSLALRPASTSTSTHRGSSAFRCLGFVQLLPSHWSASVVRENQLHGLKETNGNTELLKDLKTTPHGLMVNHDIVTKLLSNALAVQANEKLYNLGMFPSDLDFPVKGKLWQWKINTYALWPQLMLQRRIGSVWLETNYDQLAWPRLCRNLYRLMQSSGCIRNGFARATSCSHFACWRSYLAAKGFGHV